MGPKERLREAQNHIDAAAETASDPDMETSLTNLSRGIELITDGRRPLQPQAVQRATVQINSILKMAGEDEVVEHLERAREQYSAVSDEIM